MLAEPLTYDIKENMISKNLNNDYKYDEYNTSRKNRRLKNE
jgi:hypothetical protein